MLKDIGFLYQKIVKIVNLGEYSFYDKATLIDDYLHYSRFCKETIDNKVFMYRCGNSKCNFTVIVDYKNKLIELSRLECT
jgi:hypothetical protein